MLKKSTNPVFYFEISDVLTNWSLLSKLIKDLKLGFKSLILIKYYPV